MRVLGRYELLRPLAKGGMAEVYLARRRVAGVEKRLVIKRMKREHSRDPRFLDLFVREAQLSMALVQQNIVPVFDFGRIGDDVFLAMEYIDGKDLGSTLAIDRSVGLPAVLAAYVAAECCHALDHAHRRREATTPQGVIHRDVTPRNVLISWAGDVMLADFGIAAVVGQAASGGDAMGTPGYMAPEQARGETIDARADVYALGIVLWESVTGKHVRPTGSRQEAIAVAKTGELPELDASVPAGVAAIVKKATAAKPDDRYDSARSMADALDAFIVAERAKEGGVPPKRRLGEWLRERWSGDADGESTPAGKDVGEDLGHVVTFLDDGVDGVRSTRTERSVAETVDAPNPVPVPVPDQRRPRWWLAVVVVIVMIGAVTAYALRGSSKNATTTATPDAAPIAVIPAPAPDAAPAADTAPAADAAAVPASTGSGSGSGSGRKRPRGSGSATGSATATATGSATAARRPVTLGAIPWANVTVDNDPTPHETPVTLQLTVGAHRVTYTNPQLGVTRTVTVDVPADGPARHVENLKP